MPVASRAQFIQLFRLSATFADVASAHSAAAAQDARWLSVFTVCSVVNLFRAYRQNRCL